MRAVSQGRRSGGEAIRAQQLKGSDQSKPVREVTIPVRRSLARTTAPALLDRSTLGSLDWLVRKKLLSINEHNALTSAYLFLRDVEHKLQMVHDLQTHSFPAEEDELERCAIRMGDGAEDRKKAVESFHADHQRHTEIVHCTFQSLFLEPKTSPVFKTTLRLISNQKQMTLLGEGRRQGGWEITL